MKRRNPATASSPNPQIEMTSFMDIIFIFLFVVMIGYAFKCAEETDAANSKMTEADRLLAEADLKLAQAQEALEKAGAEKADIQIYEQQISELTGTVIGRRVLIVSISCTYDAFDLDHPEEWPRHLRVLGAGKEILLERDFKEGAVKNTFNKLREALTEYIEAAKKAERSSSHLKEAEKQGKTIVVFSIDRESGILTGDYETIMGIIEDLENAYENVY